MKKLPILIAISSVIVLLITESYITQNKRNKTKIETLSSDRDSLSAKLRELESISEMKIFDLEKTIELRDYTLDNHREISFTKESLLLWSIEAMALDKEYAKLLKNYQDDIQAIKQQLRTPKIGSPAFFDSEEMMEIFSGRQVEINVKIKKRNSIFTLDSLNIENRKKELTLDLVKK